MIHLFTRRRDSVRPAKAKQSQPRVEGLEERWLLYATTGDAWVYPIRVTYSFMPDGTDLGGTPSSLYSTMNSSMSTAAWQAAIAKAAAAWENAAPVNLVQVSDDGSAECSGSYEQGASNFGDIRFGAMPEAAGTLAMAYLPPPGNGGSAAGDIFFNSNVNWGSTGYDLTTVALHELGHALGLGHTSWGSTAVMWASYTGTKQSLTSDDTAGIQAIYGTRPTGTNTSYTTATPITLDSTGVATVTGVQIAAATNQNWYTVVVPPTTTGSLTVKMQSTNLSSLEPRLTLYNSSLQGLAQASASTYGGTVTITLGGVQPGQLYYIRALPNVSGPGSAGAYGLAVAAGTGNLPTIPIPDTTVAVQSGQSSSTISESTDSFASGHHHHHGHPAVHGSPAGMGHAFIVKVRHLRHLAGQR